MTSNKLDASKIGFKFAKKVLPTLLLAAVASLSHATTLDRARSFEAMLMNGIDKGVLSKEDHAWWIKSQSAQQVFEGVPEVFFSPNKADWGYVGPENNPVSFNKDDYWFNTRFYTNSTKDFVWGGDGRTSVFYRGPGDIKNTKANYSDEWNKNWKEKEEVLDYNFFRRATDPGYHNTIFNDHTVFVHTFDSLRTGDERETILTQNNSYSSDSEIRFNKPTVWIQRQYKLGNNSKSKGYNEIASRVGQTEPNIHLTFNDKFTLIKSSDTAIGLQAALNKSSHEGKSSNSIKFNDDAALFIEGRNITGLDIGFNSSLEQAPNKKLDINVFATPSIYINNGEILPPIPHAGLVITTTPLKVSETSAEVSGLTTQGGGNVNLQGETTINVQMRRLEKIPEKVTERYLLHGVLISGNGWSNTNAQVDSKFNANKLTINMEGFSLPEEPKGYCHGFELDSFGPWPNKTQNIKIKELNINMDLVYRGGKQRFGVGFYDDAESDVNAEIEELNILSTPNGGGSWHIGLWVDQYSFGPLGVQTNSPKYTQKNYRITSYKTDAINYGIYTFINHKHEHDNDFATHLNFIGPVDIHNSFYIFHLAPQTEILFNKDGKSGKSGGLYLRGRITGDYLTRTSGGWAKGNGKSFIYFKDNPIDKPSKLIYTYNLNGDKLSTKGTIGEHQLVVENSTVHVGGVIPLRSRSDYPGTPALVNVTIKNKGVVVADNNEVDLPFVKNPLYFMDPKNDEDSDLRSLTLNVGGVLGNTYYKNRNFKERPVNEGTSLVVKPFATFNNLVLEAGTLVLPKQSPYMLKGYTYSNQLITKQPEVIENKHRLFQSVETRSLQPGDGIVLYEVDPLGESFEGWLNKSGCIFNHEAVEHTGKVPVALKFADNRSYTLEEARKLVGTIVAISVNGGEGLDFVPYAPIAISPTVYWEFNIKKETSTENVFVGVSELLTDKDNKAVVYRIVDGKTIDKIDEVKPLPPEEKDTGKPEVNIRQPPKEYVFVKEPFENSSSDTENSGSGEQNGSDKEGSNNSGGNGDHSNTGNGKTSGGSDNNQDDQSNLSNETPTVHAYDSLSKVGIQALYRMQDTYQQRMGNIQTLNADGLTPWVRLTGADIAYKGLDSLESKFTRFEFGVNKGFEFSGLNNAIGVSVFDIETNNELSLGKFKERDLGVGLSWTLLTPTGSYLDVSARGARSTMKDTTWWAKGQSLSGELELDKLYPMELQAGKTWMSSISAEIGHRFAVASDCYITPTLQVQYGRIGSRNGSLKVGAFNYSVNWKPMNSLLTRVGAEAGHNFKWSGNEGNVYVRAEVLNESLAKVRFDMINETNHQGDVTREHSLKKTWVNLGTGFSSTLGKAWVVHGDIQTSIKSDIRHDWRIDLGVKYRF